MVAGSEQILIGNERIAETIGNSLIADCFGGALSALEACLVTWGNSVERNRVSTARPT